MLHRLLPLLSRVVENWEEEIHRIIGMQEEERMNEHKSKLKKGLHLVPPK